MEGTLETSACVNFDTKIYAEIRERAGLLRPLPSGEGGAAIAAGGEGDQAAEAPSTSNAARGPLPLPQGGEIPDELLVFDYIYGVLHSPDYRRTYAQFLKIDFPHIPYPASPQVFAHVAEKGGQLRRLHLMEEDAIGARPYPFKGDGDNVVVKAGFVIDPSPSAAGAAPPLPQACPELRRRGERGLLAACKSVLINISKVRPPRLGNSTSADISLRRNG